MSAGIPDQGLWNIKFGFTLQKILNGGNAA
jgi:hypothetical protein